MFTLQQKFHLAGGICGTERKHFAYLKNPNLAQFLLQCKHLLKPCLHCGKNCIKLEYFKNANKYVKCSSLAWFSPSHKSGLSDLWLKFALINSHRFIELYSGQNLKKIIFLWYLFLQCERFPYNHASFIPQILSHRKKINTV